jgi:hypothetical protein
MAAIAMRSGNVSLPARAAAAESAKIAYTYAKNFLQMKDPDNNFFRVCCAGQ